MGLTYTEAVGARSRCRPRRDFGGGQGGAVIVEHSHTSVDDLPSGKLSRQLVSVLSNAAESKANN